MTNYKPSNSDIRQNDNYLSFTKVMLNMFEQNSIEFYSFQHFVLCFSNRSIYIAN